MARKTEKGVPPFSVFLALFHVLKCVFLIFRDFQFSCHIPGPTLNMAKKLKIMENDKLPLDLKNDEITEKREK